MSATNNAQILGPLTNSDEKSANVQREHLPCDEDPEALELKKREEALRRKLDCYVAPVMMMLMLISYLDRGNIGFAATQGMTKDIELKGSELNTAVSVFYIFYILAEFPTSILVKRLQFNRVIPTITLSWGLVCLCMGFVQNFAGLVTTRIFLGFFEGCLFPSMTLFLCNWYTREELGIRIAYLFIASALSGAFGGLIAFGILYMNGVGGWPGWRWLYVLEGIITILWAACCIFLVPKSFETAYFLNEEEKQLMRQRAARTQAYSDSEGSGHYGKADIKEAAKDTKSWLHVVYAIGAYLSDRHQTRFLPLVLTAPFGIAGYAILLSPASPGTQYFATYLIATACFLCTGGNITWLSANCAPDGKRAASLGILLTLTNIGGVVSGQIYQSNAAPRYTLGHAWSLSCLAVAWCAWWLVRSLYRRRETEKDYRIAEGYVRPEDRIYTDREPDFRYQTNKKLSIHQTIHPSQTPQRHLIPKPSSLFVHTTQPSANSSQANLL
ncbi:similar to high-affinity nicotinic acid transporter [Plenodomus lingam JN3]|uniref:Similar to high-affinity nicotinic acid transporter n=1 Tax=Leptosphaeria maculans (strain JN3 / isolate v23.1.3 / race Av1-4-5-6-7-8) TaxID=985895 RepID=E5ADX9_LEPMJ|nr:similar to high-affinity nicotinic acid transporter [Plenodomus lingam JN3]CBY01418.1 similar to high-affinity nicotinic acid transporter [Plenodomus lingam JN3]